MYVWTKKAEELAKKRRQEERKAGTEATCRKVLLGEGTTVGNMEKVLDALGFELVVRRKDE